jgi:hypothetical protein
MSYEERFERVRVSLINHCLTCVRENWNRMFDMWLTCDADMEFGDGYQNTFKEQFEQYMNNDVKNRLWFAGKNIVFAISAFISYKNDATLNEVLDFTEKFVSGQLDDFGNWCNEIMMAMPDESETKEENPS